MAETTWRAEDLDLLYRASLEFNASLDPDELLPRIFDRALETLDAEAGSVWIRHGDQLVCEIARGPVGEQIEGLELPVGAGIVGSVAATGEGELVEDAREDSRFVHQVDEATGFTTRSMVTAALRAEDQVLGVLQVLNKTTGTGRFDEGDLALLDGLAATAGLAFHNARLHDAERRARDLEELLAISQEIGASLDVDRLVLSVVNLGTRVLNYDRAAIALSSTGDLELRAVSGQEKLDRTDQEMKQLERLVLWLAERGEVLYLDELAPAAGVGEDAPGAGTSGGAGPEAAVRAAFGPYLEGRGVRSLALIPLEDEEGRLGALYLESSSPAFLGDQGLEAARLLATHTSVALRNADLYQQVPFIGLLEPVARLRRRLAAMERGQLLRRVALPLAVLLAVLAFPWAERIDVGAATLRPGDRMPLRATEGGLLVNVGVDEGDDVGRGQVVARLRSDDLRMRLQQTRSDLASARLDEARARAAGDEAGAGMAAIEVDRLTAIQDILAERLERTRLRAPVDGRVLTARPHERLGERLDAGQTFVVLGRRDRLELEGRVSQREIERVQVGQRVRMKVPALPGHTFVGTLTEVAPAAEGDPAAGPGAPRFVVVRAAIGNQAELLRPGMDAVAKIVGPRRPVGFHLARPFVHWLQLRIWR